MTEAPDLKLADQCLQRAEADIEAWLASVVRGELATVAPFGQMFIYQLQMHGRLYDRSFAIEQLYKLYYRRAGGTGEAPNPGTRNWS